MPKVKKIETKEELLKILKEIPIKDKSHRNKIICSLIGHSRICNTYFGYRYCGRCGGELGDSLGSVDYGAKETIIIEHNYCPECKSNYKKCDWKDKLYCPNPFKEKLLNPTPKGK